MFNTTEITSHQNISDNVIHQRLYYAYVEAARLISGDVLEVGCGVGRGLSAILPSCDNYTAVDKNEKLLSRLRETYPKYHFIQQSIPPFSGIDDNRFDYVVSFQVIEHIADDHLFVAEIHRVLKPGGKAIISTPNRKLSLTRNPWHTREYTAHALNTLMRKYFVKNHLQGIYGSRKILDYYENNKASVAKVTRWDILNLQYRLPRQLLQLPYDLLNRINRKKLLKQNNQLVSKVSVADYHLTQDADSAFDFFCVAEKRL